MNVWIRPFDLSLEAHPFRFGRDLELALKDRPPNIWTELFLGWKFENPARWIMPLTCCWLRACPAPRWGGSIFFVFFPHVGDERKHRQVDHSSRSGYRVCGIFRDYGCHYFFDPLRSAVSSEFSCSFEGVECLVAELDLFWWVWPGFRGKNPRFAQECRKNAILIFWEPFFQSIIF